jgi:Mg2+/Co2+ transporter CorB
MSAIMSSAETALIGISKARIHALVKQGNVAAKRVADLIQSPNKFIGAILISNNLVNILISALMTQLFLGIFGNTGIVYATIIVTILVVIFGEIFPKTLAITKSVEISLTLAPLVKVVVFIFSPIMYVIQHIIDTTLKIFGIKSKGIVDEDAIREELRGTIDMSHSSGGVYKDEKDRLGGLLDLRELDVSEVMIHRKNIATFDITLPTQEFVENLLETPFTRIPVYQDNQENIVGVVHTKDLLRAIVKNNGSIADIKISDIMRRPWFIPDTTLVSNQLNSFLSKRNHFAIVVDEYGSVQGLITLEDILEEIVGDIRDEHDVEIPGFRKQSDHSYIVEGKTTIRDINRKTNWNLPDEESTTIAGLVINEAKIIPEKGQSFTFYNLRFEILERKRNQITKLRILSEKE